MGKDAKKWEIVYSWADGGQEYLSQKQYEEFTRKLQEGIEVIKIGERFLSARFVILRLNSNYTDWESIDAKKRSKERADAVTRYGLKAVEEMEKRAKQ